MTKGARDLNSRTKEHRTPTYAQRRSTGPRTDQGKKRASLNALKHGIFRQGLIVGDESFDEYDELLAELSASLQPVGRLEQILVEKLVTAIWRYRRLLKAEAAAIASERLSSSDTGGVDRAVTRQILCGDQRLLATSFLTHDVGCLSSAITLLGELRTKIENDGPDWNRDQPVLEKLFGREEDASEELIVNHEGDGKCLDPPLSGSLTHKYRVLAAANEPAGRGGESEEGAAKAIITQLTQMIEFLEPILRGWIEKQMHVSALRACTALVPGQESSERFQRYEGTLERVFDRTLSQLERLQRMRLGQPVPPPVKVTIS